MEILTNYNCMPALEVQGVPKNMRLRRRHGDVLANISERIISVIWGYIALGQNTYYIIYLTFVHQNHNQCAICKIYSRHHTELNYI